jgi:DNA-binding NtrC family response regulator
MRHKWPGNVRELENVIERGVILSTGTEFQMPELTRALNPMDTQKTGGVTLEEIECQHILQCLRDAGGKIRGPGGAAEILGIHPSTLDFRIKKLGIQKPIKH